MFAGLKRQKDGSACLNFQTEQACRKAQYCHDIPCHCLQVDILESISNAHNLHHSQAHGSRDGCFFIPAENNRLGPRTLMNKSAKVDFEDWSL